MQRTWHIPLYARRVVQQKDSVEWVCEVTDDRKTFGWTDQNFRREPSLYIYEAHVAWPRKRAR